MMSQEEPRFHPFMPGIEDVVREILHNEAINTIKEYDTDREEMYLFEKPKHNRNGRLANPEMAGIYLRGEPDLKVIAEKTYVKLLKEMSDRCDDQICTLDSGDAEDKKRIENLEKLQDRIDRKVLHDGITNHEIQEILQSIRRKTFTDRKTINPGGFIPLKDGLLRLSSWKLEDFNASHFYTWKVQGRYDPHASMNDVPNFMRFMVESYMAESIPLILDYMGYALYPGFPKQKVLGLFGPEGRGKGTLINIVKAIMGQGFGTISLATLFNKNANFPYQNIEGKNLLSDAEMRRSFERDLDFGKFNLLFGEDTIPLDKKFKAIFDYQSKAKGLFAGNIPLFRRKNMAAFLRRWLIALTRPEKHDKIVPGLAEIIVKQEGEKIVSVILNRLRALIKRDFMFCNEKGDEEYAETWMKLSDSIGMFSNETLMTDGDNLEVDFGYQLYQDWCAGKGIPPEAKHEFSSKVGKAYPKKRERYKDVNGKDKWRWVFQGCVALTDMKIKENEEILGQKELEQAERKKRISEFAKEFLEDDFSENHSPDSELAQD